MEFPTNPIPEDSMLILGTPEINALSSLIVSPLSCPKNILSVTLFCIVATPTWVGDASVPLAPIFPVGKSVLIRSSLSPSLPIYEPAAKSIASCPVIPKSSAPTLFHCCSVKFGGSVIGSRWKAGSLDMKSIVTPPPAFVVKFTSSILLSDTKSLAMIPCIADTFSCCVPYPTCAHWPMISFFVCAVAALFDSEAVGALLVSSSTTCVETTSTSTLLRTLARIASCTSSSCSSVYSGLGIPPGLSWLT